jgi:hypothetical protein
MLYRDSITKNLRIYILNSNNHAEKRKFTFNAMIKMLSLLLLIRLSTQERSHKPGQIFLALPTIFRQ